MRKRKPFCVYLTDELHAKARSKAIMDRQKFSEVIEQLLEEYLLGKFDAQKVL